MNKPAIQSKWLKIVIVKLQQERAWNLSMIAVVFPASHLSSEFATGKWHSEEV